MHAGAANQPTNLSREIFPEATAKLLQTFLRLLKLRGNAPPDQINVVVSNRDQRQIGKTFHRQQVVNLAGEIARPKNSSEKILPLAFVIDQRADTCAFNRNKRSEFLESFGNALNTCWRRIIIEKPIIPAASSRAPKRAPDRRDIDSCGHTVADQGDMWQPRNQVSARDFAISIREVIRIKRRSRRTNPLQKICADN